jgi:hypothetical protein
VLGVRTAVVERQKSIWFDTGEEDQGLELETEPEPQPQTQTQTQTQPQPRLQTQPQPQPQLQLPQRQQPAPVTLVEPPAVTPEPVAAPVASDAPGSRLPIYDSIESEWFRRGNTSFSSGKGTPAGTWTSPADEGFRVAQTVVSPVAGQTTSAGLPKRVPSANLVPGSIGARPTGQQAGQAAPAAAAGPSRSPEAVRARLSGFQVRRREARTDLPQRPGTDENWDS